MPIPNVISGKYGAIGAQMFNGGAYAPASNTSHLLQEWELDAEADDLDTTSFNAPTVASATLNGPIVFATGLAGVVSGKVSFSGKYNSDAPPSATLFAGVRAIMFLGLSATLGWTVEVNVLGFRVKNAVRGVVEFSGSAKVNGLISPAPTA